MTGASDSIGAIHPDRFERLLVVAFDPATDLVVGLCAGSYPGRRIADLSVSVAADGWQRSFHTSRRAPDGPLSMDVDEPGLGWRASVGFTPGARPATDLTVRRSRRGGPPGHDSTTEVTWGTAAVALDVDGLGSRGGDHELVALQRRSWGVEPIDATRPGAPDHVLPQQLWWFAALADGSVTAWGDEDGHGTLAAGTDGVRLRPTWAPGTRRVARAALDVRDRDRGPIGLEVVARFAMRGLGFVSPTWPHGAWHDELAIGAEEWPVAAPEPVDVHHLHHGCIVRDVDDGTTGWLETLPVGPHEPSGLTGFTTGA